MKENKIKIEYFGSIGSYDINLLIAKNLKKIYLQDKARGTTWMRDVLIERSDLSPVEYKISKAIIEAIYDENSEATTRDITQRILDLGISAIDLEIYGKKFEFIQNLDLEIACDTHGTLTSATISIKCLTYFNYIGLNFLSDKETKEGGK